MTENKKWNCNECDKCCSIITNENPNKFIDCGYMNKWIEEKPVEEKIGKPGQVWVGGKGWCEIKKVSSPKRSKLVIPDNPHKSLHVFVTKYSKYDGKEVVENIKNCIIEDGYKHWLVEIKDDTMEEKFEKWFNKWFKYSDVSSDYINTWNAWLEGAKNETLKYKPLIDDIPGLIEVLLKNNWKSEAHILSEHLKKLNQPESGNLA